MNPRDKAYSARIGSIYSSQTKRYRTYQEADYKRAKVAPQAWYIRPLPYTRAELDAWLAERGGHEHVFCCAYCDKVLDFSEIQLDHDTPLVRGGTWKLPNVKACCEDCNRIKGKLTGPEYRAFRHGLDTFPAAARADILGRLKTGAMAGRIRFFGGAAGRGKTPNPPPDTQEKF